MPTDTRFKWTFWVSLHGLINTVGSILNFYLMGWKMDECNAGHFIAIKWFHIFLAIFSIFSSVGAFYRFKSYDVSCSVSLAIGNLLFALIGCLSVYLLFSSECVQNSVKEVNATAQAVPVMTKKSLDWNCIVMVILVIMSLQMLKSFVMYLIKAQQTHKEIQEMKRYLAAIVPPASLAAASAPVRSRTKTVLNPLPRSVRGASVAKKKSERSKSTDKDEEDDDDGA